MFTRLDRASLWVLKAGTAFPFERRTSERCGVHGKSSRVYRPTDRGTTPEDLTCSIAGDASQRSMILAKRRLF